MRTVWKFLVPLDGLEVQLWQPRVVLVGYDSPADDDGFLPTVWIEHTPSIDGDVQFAVKVGLKPTRLLLRFVGTGHHYTAADGEHVGSAQCGPYVWHVLQRTVAS